MTKKFIHSLFAFLLILPLTFALISCSDDDDDNNVDLSSLNGDWFYEDSDYYIYFEFNNGSVEGETGSFNGSYEEIDETFHGTYTISGDTVTLNLTTSENEKGTFVAKISGNKLLLQVDDEVITLERDDRE